MYNAWENSIIYTTTAWCVKKGLYSKLQSIKCVENSARLIIPTIEIVDKMQLTRKLECEKN